MSNTMTPIAQLEEQTEDYVLYTVNGGPGAGEEGGDLDLQYAPQLLEGMEEELAGGKGALILDLAPVTFVDSAGLGVILQIWHRARQKGRGFYVVGLQSSVIRAFRILDLGSQINVRDGVADAIAEIRAGA